MKGGKKKKQHMGPCWHTTAHDPLSITSQISHQSLSDKSSKTGKLGESQPTHRLHHLSQEPWGTRAHAHTHARAHTSIQRHPTPPTPPVFRDQTFNQTFLQLTHTISEECEMAPCVLVHPWRERRRRLERGRLRAVSTVCVTNDGDGGEKKRERR